MLTRRGLFGYLAALPFVGGMFANKVVADDKFNNTVKSLGGFRETAKLVECHQKQIPSLHIPNEDGSMTCIPLNFNFNLRIINLGMERDRLELFEEDKILEMRFGKITKNTFRKIPSEIPPFLRKPPEVA